MIKRTLCKSERLKYNMKQRNSVTFIFVFSIGGFRDSTGRRFKD